MEEKPNLYQKIQLVSNEIKNIEKNLTVGKVIMPTRQYRTLMSPWK